MKVLITGGRMRTVVKIDDVRTMTIENEASGGTAVRSAKYFAQRGCRVTLVLFVDVNVSILNGVEGINVIYYESYFDFFEIMEREVRSGQYDAIIHSVAVSDYVPDGVFAGDEMRPVNATGKLSSRHSQIFCKLIPTQKILALFKKEWGFKGVVIGFKLETGISKDALIQKAVQKIDEDIADVIVANLQETYRQTVYIVGVGVGNNAYEHPRNELVSVLYEKIAFECQESHPDFWVQVLAEWEGKYLWEE